MGAPVSFHPTVSSGHECYPGTPSVSGFSPDVFINSKNAIKTGTIFVPHQCNPLELPHPDTFGPGSGTVRCNGGGLGRIGDDLIQGGALGDGSTNVFAGG